MPALVVEVDGRVLRLEGQPVYRIGRAIEADVVLTAGSVSRTHAELRATGDGWVLVDSGSQFGTYVDEERITDYPIERRINVRCGPPAPGSTLTIVPAEQYDAAATPSVPAPPPFAGPAAVAPPTGVFAAPPSGAPLDLPPPPGAAAAPGAPPAPARPAAAPVGGRPPGTPGLPPAISGMDATQVLAPQRGPGQPGAQAPRTGPDLLIVAEGREHRFRHPTQITVGRRSDCTVVIGDPACSRVHGRIDPVAGGWTYTNLSNEGTWLEGRKVATRPFDERVGLRLGHPVAGPELTLVPILSAGEEERRIARRRWTRRLTVIGGAAAALLLVGGIVAALLLTGDSEPTDGGRASGSSSLESAKAATVKISADTHLLDNPSATGSYHGSGSIIRSDGLILTNAHVAAPESPGLEEKYGQDEAVADPDYLLISLTDGRTDTNSPPAYRARVVEADGYLDAAVIQIYADADGNELTEELDLPTVPIGTSGDLRAGDNITVLGFPAVAGSGDSITVTTGVVSTVLNDPDLGPKSEIDTDARIAPGNSGGTAIDASGELIGIPTSLFGDEGAPVFSGRIRAIDVVKDLIAAAEAEVG